MKKINKLVLSLIIILMPCIVMADMAIGSAEASYSVRVNNPDGAVCYDDGETTSSSYNYDDILKVSYEKENYLVIYDEETYESCEIKKSDVIVFSNDFDFSIELSEKEMYVMFDGAYLYKGPSVLYGKVDGDVMVPVGTTLKSKYYDDLWMYVTYNGVAGWVFKDRYNESPYDFNSSLVYKTNKSILVKDDIYLFETPYDYNENKTSNKVIKKGTNVKASYYINTWIVSSCYYLEGDNVSGWTCNEDKMIKKIDSTAYSVRAFKVYEDPSLTKEIGTIPANVFFDLTSEQVKWSKCQKLYGVSYNGIKGYALSEETGEDDETYTECNEIDNFVEYSEIYYDYTVKNEVDLYDNINGKLSGKNSTIGDIVHVTYEYYGYDDEQEKYIYWRYIKEYNAWTCDDYIFEEISEDNSTNSDNSTNVTITYDDTIPVTSTKKVLTKNIIIYSVGGAIGVSIIALTTIILVNKKKKNKKDIVSEDKIDTKEE